MGDVLLQARLQVALAEGGSCVRLTTACFSDQWSAALTRAGIVLALAWQDRLLKVTTPKCRIPQRLDLLLTIPYKSKAGQSKCHNRPLEQQAALKVNAKRPW